MPTSPAGSSSLNPPALVSTGVAGPRYQGRPGSHVVRRSSLLGVSVVWWIVAITGGWHTVAGMRAVVVSSPGGPEVLQVAEVSDPVAGFGEVVIEVAAAGVNRADLLQRQGHYPTP